MKKILVTGSSGMLGTDLVEVLSSDFDVYGLSRHDDSQHLRHGKLIQLDLTDTPALRSQILKIKPDFVIHAAAFTKVDLCEDPNLKASVKKQNTEVVEALIDVCNEVGALLIFFSTDYVFSGAKKLAYLEDDEIEPINYYGQTKALAESALKKKSKKYLIFRITWLYGLNGNHFPGAILKQAQKNKEINVVSDQWGRPTWSRDVAHVMKGLLTARNNSLDQYNKQIFHIGNVGQINWSGYARRILDQNGFVDVAIKSISSAELGRPARRPMNSVLSLDKAKRLLGVQMRSWEEALDEFLKELKRENDA